jgi:hypothetical protein
MFEPWVRPNDFSINPVRIEIESLEGVEFNQDLNTVLFKVKYQDPTDFGLLIRKNDTLMFDRVLKFDYVSTFLDNSTTFLESFQLQNNSGIRVDLVFDWSLDYMQQLRSVSMVTFWILIAVVGVLWLTLVLRNVSGVAMSIFIDYA